LASSHRRPSDADHAIPKILALGPNNDPGHQGILRAYKERAAQVELRLSVPQQEFWQLAHAHGLLVGNSSSGIIELASLGVAVINLGQRQAGRERSGNVIDIPFDDKALRNALTRALSDATFRRRVASCRNIYGDGHAAPRIAAVLAGLKLTHPLRPGGINPVKHFHDLAH
ncbi:MAG: UDP-N-acetylglucosamine 2-epimerase, partial [Phycisphaerae bacterium]